jgi:type I restriction enzyme S subunit
MTNGWQVAKIGEVAEPIERAEEPQAGTTYRQVGVRLWGQGAYERESIDGSETKYKTLSRIESGDIIVNKIWARNGSVAVVSDALAGCFGSGEFPTFAPDRNKLEPKWFHWITKTRWFWEACDEKSQGTSGKNRIRPEKFLDIEIPLPPLTEQRRIVAHIESLAARVNEAQRLREEATQEAELLSFATARKIISELDDNIVELGELVDESRNGIQTGPFGAQLGSGDFVETGHPVITIGNVQYSGLETAKLKFVSKEKAKQLSRFLVQEGDILFARMGTVGRCCVVPKEAEGWIFNYHLIRVALDKSKVEPRFIHWLIRASQDIENKLEEKIRGATREGVNSKIVAALPCRVPPLDEQRRVVAYLDGLQAKVNALREMQVKGGEELSALMPSILDKAFKGEL